MEFRPAEAIKGYHMHIYYDGATKQWAGHLRRELAKLFPAAEIGRWRDKAPQGPHPQSHFQVAFDTPLFAEIVPWLMYNRDDLVVLVHPEAEDSYDDHAHYPLWLGGRFDLRYTYAEYTFDPDGSPFGYTPAHGVVLRVRP